MSDANNPDLGVPPLIDDGDETFGLPPQPAPRKSRRAPLPGLDDDTERLTEEDVKIQQILRDEDYAGAKLEINRRSDNGTYGYLFSVSLSDWSEDSKRHVAEKYGGGEYKAKVRKAAGAFGKSFTFTIDSAVKPKGFESTAPNNGGNSLDLIRQAKQLTGDNTPLLMQMMQAQQAQSMQFMQMMQAQSAENLKALVTIMARPAAATPQGNDKIIEILLAKALTPPPPPPPPMDIDKMIAIVGKLRELTDNGAEPERAPREEKSDFFGDVMRALPSILKSFAAIRIPQAQHQQIETQAQAQQAAPQAAPVNVTPQPATPNPEPAKPDAAQVNRDALGQFLPQLVTAAETDTNTDEFAEMIDGVMDDDQFDGIITLLERDDWLAVLIDAHAPVMKWSNWFTRLRTSLLKLAEDDTDAAIEVDTVPATPAT